MAHEQSMVSAEIVQNREMAPQYFLMTLNLPPTFLSPCPGQFVMVRTKDRQPPFLGRPFSVYNFYRDKKVLMMELLYRIVGQGTRTFSRLKPGDELEVLGPLGRGFKIDERNSRIILVAGGIGVAPLSFLASYVRREVAGRSLKIACYVGARSLSDLVGIDRLEAMCSEIFVSTDDGSRGYRGQVTGLFEIHLNARHGDIPAIYTCGPYLMIRQLAHMLEGTSAFCQASMEERMACGIGACLGCAIPVKSQNNGDLYKRICKDGPVFDICDLVWE
jgi:dihydroorotate dehydrogenase electron transfer subunit